MDVLHYRLCRCQDCGPSPASQLLSMHAQGARLVAVGLGEPVQARQFCEILSFPVDMLYSDPTGAAYSALGFRHALRYLACPAVVLPAVPFMLPGVLLQ